MASSLSLRAKLFAGFGATVGLTAILAGYALIAAYSSGAKFSEYKSTSEASVLFGDMAKQITEMRLEAMKFRATGQQETLSAVEEKVHALQNADTGLIKLGLNGVSQEFIASIQEHSQAYADGFGESHRVQNTIDTVFEEELHPANVRTRQALTTVREAALRDGNLRAAYVAGAAQEHLLLGRYYMLKFLLDNGDAAKERVFAELQRSQEQIALLADAIEEPALINSANEANDNLNTVTSLFQQITDAVASRNDIFDTQLDKIGPELMGDALTALDAQIERQNTVGPEIAENFVSKKIVAAIVGVLALIVGAAIALTLGTAIARAIKALTTTMQRLANDDTDVVIAYQNRRDEIGDMARTIEVFKQNAVDRKRLQEVAQEQSEAQKASYKQTETAIETFRNAASEILVIAKDRAVSMQNSATELGAMSTQAKTRSADADAAATETAQSIQTVAAATEQLTSSIQEISGQVANATHVVSDAAEKTQLSVQEVEALSAAGQRIGTVVSLIQDIAEQTNLLALNATIEAARAGDAGRGFAVVASEVKELAAQTAKATEEISEQVGGIQSSTRKAVDAIREIATISDNLSGVTATIAAAVEEQGASTQEISHTTNTTSHTTSTLAQSVTEVSQAIDVAERTANAVLTASDEVAQQTEALNSAVEKFYSDLRLGTFDRREEEDPNYAGPERRKDVMSNVA